MTKIIINVIIIIIIVINIIIIIITYLQHQECSLFWCFAYGHDQAWSVPRCVTIWEYKVL